MAKKRRPLDTGPTILNVFFHGLFAFLDRPNSIDVLLPEVDVHSYRVGGFFAETSLEPSILTQPYTLSGVDASATPVRMDPTVNLTALTAEEPDGQGALYASLSFPPPANIIVFQTLDLSAAVTNPELFSSTNASMLHIFQYTFQGNAENVTLGDHGFTKSIETIGGENFMSLHIFSEEDFPPLADHPIQGFEAVVGLFPSLRGNVDLKPNPPDPPPLPQATLIEPGTIVAEYEDLQLRNERLAVLGADMREGNWPNNGGSLIGSSVRTCTSILMQF